MNTLFTALLLVCDPSSAVPDCKSMANPALYDNVQICLQSVAEGIQAFEVNGFTVVRYTCYEWTTDRDLKSLGL